MKVKVPVIEKESCTITPEDYRKLQVANMELAEDLDKSKNNNQVLKELLKLSNKKQIKIKNENEELTNVNNLKLTNGNFEIQSNQDGEIKSIKTTEKTIEANPMCETPKDNKGNMLLSLGMGHGTISAIIEKQGTTYIGRNKIGYFPTLSADYFYMKNKTVGIEVQGNSSFIIKFGFQFNTPSF